MLIVSNAPVLGADAIVRVATFNLKDVRQSEATQTDNPRLRRLAEVIQRIRPNVLLLNEIETIQSDDQASTADLFIRNYLMVPQGDDLRAIEFVSHSPSTNTGIHSGMDLDQSGSFHDTVPPKSIRQTPEQRAYGGDCFGFGGFPGQYGMALLVDPRLKIDNDSIRTFQHYLWKDLPDSIAPTNPDGSSYYSEQAWDIFRLSSKTFADIPIVLPNGTTLHALISHPTPPAFDGPEMRNKHRNRDEIKLIRSYIDGDDSLYDDDGVRGGLDPDASFVVLGDLNADPVDGSSLGNPIRSYLMSSNRLATDAEPRSCVGLEQLDEMDTSSFRLRVDYVLPSVDCEILDAGVWRHGALSDEGFASDHFPVWVDLLVPAPE
jgi:endonuclease/exonuclease/phosphatase family metal-dependent hydrolase